MPKQDETNRSELKVKERESIIVSDNFEWNFVNILVIFFGIGLIIAAISDLTSWLRSFYKEATISISKIGIADTFVAYCKKIYKGTVEVLKVSLAYILFMAGVSILVGIFFRPPIIYIIAFMVIASMIIGWISSKLSGKKNK